MTSRRRILNATTLKKRDTLMNLTTTNATGAPQTTWATGRAFLQGSAVNIMCWSPTCRVPSESLRNNPGQLSTGKPYYVGLKENLRIDTSSGRPWRHRRICFTTKNDGNLYEGAPDAIPVWKRGGPIDSNVGYVRPWQPMIGGAYTELRDHLINILFQGTITQDFDNAVDAKVDRTRVDIKFDRTWTIRPQTTVGSTAPKKLWHPMHKMFHYDQDESGKVTNYTDYAAATRQGMGDYYVVDIFDCFQGTSSDLLAIGGESTLYWHER